MLRRLARRLFGYYLRANNIAAAFCRNKLFDMGKNLR